MDGNLPDLSKFAIKQPKPQGDESVARVVDDEASKLGWSENARLSFLGDVGRENGWNRNTIFGGHVDPASFTNGRGKIENRGIISWNGSRKDALDNYLKSEGVYGKNDDDELRGMVRFADKEMRDNPEWQGINKNLRDPNISTYDASENLRKYIKYSPDAPYNSPDSEFRVANNAKWANRAKSLGLGTLPDLSKYSGKDENDLPDLSQFAANNSTAPAEDVRVDTDLKTGLPIPKGTQPTYPTYNAPLPKENPPVLAPQPETATVAEQPVTLPPNAPAPPMNIAPDADVQGITDGTIPAPNPLAPVAPAPEKTAPKVPPTVQKVVASQKKIQPNIAPAESDADYKTWLDYKNKFENANLTDSHDTRAQFHNELAQNNNFGNVNITSDQSQNVVGGASPNVVAPVAAEQNQSVSPKEKPGIEAKNDAEVLSKGSAGGATVDLEQKPANMTANEYLLKSAISPVAAKYGLTNDEINNYVATKKAQYYGSINNQDLPKYVAALKKGKGNAQVEINIPLADVNEILQRRSNESSVNDDLVNPAVRAQVGLEENNLEGGLEKNQQNIAQLRQMETDRTPEGQLRRQAENNIYNSPLSGGTNAEVEEEYQRLKKIEDEKLSPESHDILKQIGYGLNNAAAGTQFEDVGNAVGGAVGALGSTSYQLAGLARFEPIHRVAEGAANSALSYLGYAPNNSDSVERLLRNIGEGGEIIDTASSEYAPVRGKIANFLGKQAVELPKFIGATALSGGNVVLSSAILSGTESLGRGNTLTSAGADAAKGAVFGGMLEGGSALGKALENGIVNGATKDAAKNLVGWVAGNGVRVGTVTGGSFLAAKAGGADNKDAGLEALKMLILDVGLGGREKLGEVKDLSGKVIRDWRNGEFKDYGFALNKDGAVDVYDLTGKNLPSEAIQSELATKPTVPKTSATAAETKPEQNPITAAAETQQTPTADSENATATTELNLQNSDVLQSKSKPMPERAVTLAAQETALADKNTSAVAVLYPKGENVPEIDLNKFFPAETKTGDTLVVNEKKLQTYFAENNLGTFGRGKAIRLIGEGKINAMDLIGGKAKEFADTSGGSALVTTDKAGNELVASKVSDNSVDKLSPKDLKVAGKQAELDKNRFGENAASKIVPTDEVVNSRIENRPINENLKTGDEIRAENEISSSGSEIGSSDSRLTSNNVQERSNNLLDQSPQQKLQEAETEKPKARVDYAERPNLAAKLNVFTERGTKAAIEPKVVDQSDLLTSLDENYPPEFQPRDRSRAASKAQISEIANKLNPEFLGDSPKASDGRPLVAPVKMPDGQTKYAVISGNGRTEGIREAYNLDNEGSKKYSEFAKSKGASDAKQPVYVGILDPNEIKDFPNFAKEANESATAQMSATERAKADAERLPSDLMNKFVASDDGTIHGAANRDFVRGFVETVPSTERGTLQMPDGSLSQEGVARVRNAIFARAFGDSEAGLTAIQRMSESTDNNVKNITNALLAKSGHLAALKEAAREGTRYKEFDIAPDLGKAMEKYASLKDAGTSIDDYIKQGNLFGTETTSLQSRLMQVFDFHKRSAKAIRGILDNYLSAVEEIGNPNQQNLFGETNRPSAESVLEGAVRSYERNTVAEPTEQFGLFNQNSRRENRSEARQPGDDNAAQIEPKAAASQISDRRLSEGRAAVEPETSNGEIKDQAERAAKVLNDDPDKMRRVVTGQEPFPEGLKGGEVIKTMSNHAEATGDAQLIKELADSPLTSSSGEHAEEMRSLAEREPNSPLVKLKEIQANRESAAQKKLGKKSVEEAKTEIADGIKKQVKVSAPKPSDWRTFLDSIQCNY